MRIRTRSNLRGLRDIRTRSGKVESASVPYMAYMKIGCLEMEKARREKEKFSAATRIKNINTRLSEIEAEKGELLTSLGERCARERPGKAVVATEGDRTGSNENNVGFKIRY
ncbi:MAG: hypothetical protein FJY85_14950 [Deltaproteobacteria bacterium]|nr:hypothetical protein [Deltaproteobacteria bacterium]